MSETNRHSSIGPSQAPRYVPCPGSVQLQAQYPGPDKGDEANEGNVAHAAGANILRTVRTGESVTIEPYCPDNAEMVNAVEMYVMDVLRIMNARDLDFSRLLVEARAYAPQIHNDLWGTLDAGIADLKRKELIVWDFKYGWGLVDEWDNLQGVLYLLGLWNYYPDLKPERFIFRIVQPRPYCSRGRIREYAFDVPGMRGYIDRIKMAVTNALSQSPQLNAGIDWCRNCTALLHCPAAADMTARVFDATTQYHGINLPPEALGREYDQMLKAKEILQHRLTVLEQEVFSTIKTGESIPGWTIESTPGRKKWTVDPDQIIAMGDLYDTNLRKPDTLTVTQTLQLKKIPRDVIDAISEQSRNLKLVKDDGRKARQIFGGTNAN